MEETPQTQNPAENPINPPVNPSGYGGISPEKVEELAALGTTPLGQPSGGPDVMRSEARTADVEQPEIKFGSALSVGKVQGLKDSLADQDESFKAQDKVLGNDMMPEAEIINDPKKVTAKYEDDILATPEVSKSHSTVELPKDSVPVLPGKTSEEIADALIEKTEAASREFSNPYNEKKQTGEELLLEPDGQVKDNWSDPSANTFFTDPKPPVAT